MRSVKTALMVLIGIGILVTPALAQFSIELEQIGRYESGIFDDSAAEIVTYDHQSKRVFVTNAANDAIDALDISDPANPRLAFSIDLTPYGSPNSVAVARCCVLVAVEAAVKQDPGFVVMVDDDGNYIIQVTAGALPEMITGTPNGKYALVANEGEPNDDYTVDPEGTVSIIDISKGCGNVTQNDVCTVDFSDFNSGNIDPTIRIFGPNATVAQDLEPEYITVSKNSRIAWVACQENNAMAKIDIKKGEVLDLYGLGFKNHDLPENPMDASNKDDAINIATGR